ncbi:hypothetical protein BVRB_4g092560 [Beta vulgaris subsp. vulgaris]|nr:hypothetical protein BVRB_4g092560 [Beta vulgaris subsp. vulgaris]
MGNVNILIHFRFDFDLYTKEVMFYEGYNVVLYESCREIELRLK